MEISQNSELQRASLPVEPALRRVSTGQSAAGRRVSMSAVFWTPMILANVAALALYIVPTYFLPSIADQMVHAQPFGISLQRFFMRHLTAGGDPELFDSLNRVQEYERQLRLKASQLDAVLQDAQSMDDSAHIDSTVVGSDFGGVGEGDDRRSPVITNSLSNNSDAAALAKDGSFMELLDRQLKQARQLPIGYPVQGNISSNFGWRVSPFSSVVKMHEGVDISIDRSARVLATADGVVIEASYKGAFGNVVIIDHGNGYETVYAHLSKISSKLGERVCRGEGVGFAGSSGHATGPHVHYEVRKNGRAVNPVAFLNLASLLQLVSK